jgi:hypothetical protein
VSFLHLQKEVGDALVVVWFCGVAEDMHGCQVGNRLLQVVLF